MVLVVQKYLESTNLGKAVLSEQNRIQEIMFQLKLNLWKVQFLKTNAVHVQEDMGSN